MAPHAVKDSVPSSTPVATKTQHQSQTPVRHQAQRTQKCVPLHVSGTQIVNDKNEPVILKGAGLGGHLNMENFITGYAGHESQHRSAIAEVLGEAKATFFFDKFLEYFFTDADAQYFASLGLNCIRVPFNYRHFIHDQNPGTYKPDGFHWLDRIVNICAKHNLYVVLDLHAVPGGQNQDWHSDSNIAEALFWEYRVFQDQATDLWVAIAKHYAGNPVVAGYNLLNEPADPQHERLIAWYARTERAVRAADPDTMLFIDGNTYAMDFTQFPEEVLPNAVYACHDYAMLGFPILGQKPYSGTQQQNDKLKRSFDRKIEYMRSKKVPVWNGEFGPVYADEAEKGATETNEARFGVLKEQLKIYAESNISWSIWLYKDIGYQGMVYVDPNSAYMNLISDFVAKKKFLGLDFWGVVDKEGVKAVYEPFVEGIKAMVPEHLRNKKYPKMWTFDRQVERVVRECLLSEYMGWEMAELFKGKSEAELDELAASFKFENCKLRDGLNKVLSEDAARSS